MVFNNQLGASLPTRRLANNTVISIQSVTTEPIGINIGEISSGKPEWYDRAAADRFLT
jgi:hypothetical protein